MGSGLDQTALASTLATTNPRETIRPTDRTDAMAGPPGSAVDLAEMGARLVLGTMIGEGGMAIVRSATQTSLGREVAVKTLRDLPRSADEASRLLREAWITGALEHPNIVPVHDLGGDAQGRPLLVLKRIEGSPWSALIDQPLVIREKFGMDPLEWNLRQLAHVCHAVAFAHSRGILHRDLKPQNIMIGGFGEVYVLDWGIAVSLVDDGTGRLPLASSCRDTAGTLAYMAPEMLGDAELSVRTDVYLLGAILFEIATTRPPHMTASIAETLASISVSEPDLPPEIPAELAAICRRAMARDPADRYPSADTLRIAVQGFLEHRGSAEIARDALARLVELETLLQTRSDDRVLVYQMFGQCRFGFEAALCAWPDNTSARSSLDRALIAMATYELDHGDARAATVMLAGVTATPKALADRLAQVEHEAGEKTRRLERLDADQDANRGSVTRTIFLVLFGIAWSTMPLAAGLFPAIEVGHGLSILVTGASIAVVIAIAIRARVEMTRSAHNRGVLATVFIGLVLHGMVEAMAWALGLDMVATHLIAIGVWAGIVGTAAIFLDRALMFPTLGFLIAIVATVQTPDRRLWAISASLGVLLGTIIYILHQARRGRRIYGLADLLRPAL